MLSLSKASATAEISTCERLEDVCIDRGITLLQDTECPAKSLSVQINGTPYIIEKTDLPEDERSVALAHEIAHIDNGLLYDIKAKAVGRDEEQAFRKSLKYILPYKKLTNAITRKNSYDVAEYLDLPEEYVSKAMVYYFETKGKERPQIEA